MWLIASYQPVALFTLKSGLATATGAKTLLVPTPFAIRTALLDVAIRTEGVERGAEAFKLLHALKLALRPPEYAVVTNLFAKILKPTRSDKDRDSAMTRTVAFREYVQWQGDLELAFEGADNALKQVRRWLPYLTYLGRRGGFVQFNPPTREESTLRDSFTLLTQPVSQASTFPLGVLQVMDDWGPTLTYQKIDVYSDHSIKRPHSGDDRIRYGVVIPYQFRRAGRGFTLYERL